MSKTQMPRDFDGVKMPVFTPSKVVEIVQTGNSPGLWIPAATDTAFFSPSDITVVITPSGGSSQTAFLLNQFIPLGIIPGTTFTFTDNSENLIVVM